MSLFLSFKCISINPYHRMFRIMWSGCAGAVMLFNFKHIAYSRRGDAPHIYPNCASRVGGHTRSIYRSHLSKSDDHIHGLSIPRLHLSRCPILSNHPSSLNPRVKYGSTTSLNPAWETSPLRPLPRPAFPCSILSSSAHNQAVSANLPLARGKSTQPYP